MIAVRANPLASTVWDIRRGASTSFQASLDLLKDDEKVRILNDIRFLSTRTPEKEFECDESGSASQE